MLSAVPLGIVVVPGDSDLELCRTHIERLQEVRHCTWHGIWGELIIEGRKAQRRALLTPWLL